MEVLIAGAGEMGRWFGRTLAAHPDAIRSAASDDELDVAFADRDLEVARSAAAELDASARTVPLDGEETFELVCIAVPIPAAASAIATHAGRARSAIVDVTGELTTPLEAMAEHAPDCERASLHPLFAADSAPGTVPIAVTEEGPIIDGIRAALEAAGNSLVATTPTEHDEAMETIQSAAHTAVLAYALAAKPVPEEFETPVSAALDELVDQVTGNEPRVYADIQSTFDGADRVAEAAAELAEADTDTFETLYVRAGDAPPATREKATATEENGSPANETEEP